MSVHTSKLKVLGVLTLALILTAAGEAFAQAAAVALADGAWRAEVCAPQFRPCEDSCRHFA